MRVKTFKKVVASAAALAICAQCGWILPASAATYTATADLSKIDKQLTYDSATGSATLSLAAKAWSKLDLTPYTVKGEQFVKSVTISYTDNVPSQGRSTIAFYDKDEAKYYTNAYEDTTGSAILYGVTGSNTAKKVMYLDANKATKKITGTFAVDTDQQVSLTFDFENSKVSGNIGSQTVSNLPIQIDSIDTMGIYSWSACTYVIKNMSITTVTADETYYSVTFDVNGKTSPVQVVSNGSVAESDIPDTELAGYTLKGWAVNGDETNLLTTAELLTYKITGVTTIKAVYEKDTSYIEPIVSAVLSGPSSMTFGADVDTAAANTYTLTLTGELGTVITADTADSRVSDFNIDWDVKGFKTENDTDGQYCDSYAEFATHTATATSVDFMLRQVAFNFYGKVTADITYNGQKLTAELPVVALGDTAKPASQIAPAAGYPTDINAYHDDLLGYEAAVSADNVTGSDIVLGDLIIAGSDSGKKAVLMSDATGKFFRVYKTTSKKSSSFTRAVSVGAGQVIYEGKVRFNSASGAVSITSGYPVWQDKATYASIANLSFDGSKLTLNSSQDVLTAENPTPISAGVWYKTVISVDTSSKTVWAKVYDASGTTLLGETPNVSYASDKTPMYYSLTFDNATATATADFAGYKIYYPTADSSKYTLTATQDTLSIPNGDTAELTASLKTAEGYDITGEAVWTVLEEDMQGVIVTPNTEDSHKATVTLGSDAAAGTATVQVDIAGNKKTIELTITSSAESVKFTEASASLSIPLDPTAVETGSYKAIVVDGQGRDLGREITYALYDKTNTNPYTPGAGITFDADTAVITVTSVAQPATFVVRATGTNSGGETISKAVKVTVHGLSFDFGSGADGSVVEGYTDVNESTTYTDKLGFGIEGAAAAGGTASDSDVATDYLEGSFTFKAKVTPGELYRVTVNFAGDLATEKVDAVNTGHTRVRDAADTNYTGYTVKTTEITEQVYDIPVVDDILDMAFTDAKVASISIEKVVRQANAKPSIYSIGDSTLGNNGSYGYDLARDQANYPELANLITKYNNNGKGSRTLISYVEQGWLDGVLAVVKPGDIVTIGNMGTNSGGLSGDKFKAPLEYYVDACIAMGAKVILTSYTPHGAVGDYASCYDSATATFTGYRTDAYDSLGIRVIYEERKNDDGILGFIDIGKNADNAFNAYAADYANNGYSSADEAAKAIIACFPDHNHYNGLATDLILEGYGDVPGVVSELVRIISESDGDPSESYVLSDVSKTAGTIEIKATGSYRGDVTLIIASYDAGGKLIGLAVGTPEKNADGSVELGAMAVSGTDLVKGFAWDMTKAIPLANCLEIRK